ncbi:MAG: hypothetical protein H0U57_01105 [Tatlockia sp.]|nr:hypothetical protein [Tatlockia sp.]
MPLIKFKSLSFQDVIESKISDHDPILIETLYGMFCFFNILCRCDTRQPSGFNNAFNRIETLEEYTKRLKTITEILAELQQTQQIVGFMLQEAPNLQHKEEGDVASFFYKELKSKLPYFEVDALKFARKTHKTRSCLFSAFDLRVFPKQIPMFDKSPGRSQEIQLIDSQGKQLRAINIHGDHRNQAKTSKLVIHSAKKGAILGGDLNIFSNTKEALAMKEELQHLRSVQLCIVKARLFSTLDAAIFTQVP